MDYHVPERLHHHLCEPVIVHSSTLPWTPSPQRGVERRFLERDGGEVARATSIVRYAPGSSFPEHVHHKGEEYLVLSGIFSDEHGDFAEGTYVRNPPGSRHAPFTKGGCVIFVKLRQMRDTEQNGLVVQTQSVDARPTEIEGLSRIALHCCESGEQVAIEILEPQAQWRDRGTLGGEEILVLAGSLLYGDEECRTGTWVRFPSGREPSLESKAGCRLWTKRGHLRRNQLRATAM